MTQLTFSVDRFPALAGLQAPPQETWADGSVPLEQRGVDWRWLIGLVRGLVDDINAPRAAAIEEASRAESHNRAGFYNLHDQPDLPVPVVPPPALLNVHRFVDTFVKPLTASAKAPLYALVPEEHRGLPQAFISHTWNSLLVGPPQQAIGTLDAIEHVLGQRGITYVWIDVASYNQHTFEAVAPDMEKVVNAIGHVVFAATPVPVLDRAWCLWELLCSDHAGAKVDVSVNLGYRNDKIMSSNGFFRSFRGVKNAAASVPADRKMILDTVLARYGTTERADAHLEELIRKQLSGNILELKGREEDLGFRPYPWIVESSIDPATREAMKQQTFEPYFGPEIRGSVVFGTDETAYDSLIRAGTDVPDTDRQEFELRTATEDTLLAIDAARRCDTATVARLVSDGLDPNTRLYGASLATHAAHSGQLDTVRYLLDANADPDGGRGEISPLRIAADKGFEPVVRLLAERGATIDARGPDGWTALLYAAASGHLAILEFLADRGADVNVVSGAKRATPILMGCANGHHEVVRALLDRGADVHCTDRNGETPLHWAAHGQHRAIVEDLLSRGGDLAAVDSQGRTPRDLAGLAERPDPSVLALLSR